MIYLTSSKIAKIPNIEKFLGDDVTVSLQKQDNITALAGWGRKSSGKRAEKLARELSERSSVPFLLLEDGFLRSVERNDPPFSLVIDKKGIYYDAHSSSSLEEMIREPVSAEEAERVKHIIALWQENTVSKYNHARDYAGLLPDSYVLVCDQTFQDSSIAYGQADQNSFRYMLQAALDENPDAAIVIKTHPDSQIRKKSCYFTPEQLPQSERIRVISDPCHPVELLKGAEKVYCVTSQMGFEALLWNKTVRCFGMPFYAGWGLTQDHLPASERRSAVSLEQLVFAALVRYARYIHPVTGNSCSVEEIIRFTGFQLRQRRRFAPHLYAYRFSFWKKPIIRAFFAGSAIRFKKYIRQIPEHSDILIWGRKKPDGLPETSHILHVEDGFLRSVGLGAEHTRPLSWVIDDIGIYYDATSPSRLEDILKNTEFDEELLKRAQALHQMILDSGLTKYNSSKAIWSRPQGIQSVILVPGQVEQDASIRFGARQIKTNYELVENVRKRYPDAYLVYKPHPDIVAGLRQRSKSEEDIKNLADEVVTDADMAQMLKQVDEVHTLTSLTGFEALLRQIPVTCYGQPFYAGWGLTRDIFSVERRMRMLKLEELIAGCLILYPTYISRTASFFLTPEEAVNELISWRSQPRIYSRSSRHMIWRLFLNMWKYFYKPPAHRD